MSVEIERKKVKYNFRIDLIKSIALFLVVLYHASFLKENIGVMTFCVCSTCVPLFFIVNGFLSITPPLKESTSYLKKLAKIFFLIIIWSFILVTSIMLINAESFSLSIILKRMINNELGYCNWIWFLNTMFILYIFKPFLQIVLYKKKLYCYFMAIVSIFVIVLPSLSYVLTKVLGNIYDITYLTKNINPFYGWQSFSLFYFAFGVVLNFYKNIKTMLLCILLFTSFGISYLINSSVKASIDIVWYNYGTLWTAIFSFSICFGILKIGNLNSSLLKIIQIIGRNTFGGYLIEAILLAILRRKNIVCAGWLDFIFLVTIVYCMSILLSYIFSKIPKVAYLFRF